MMPDERAVWGFARPLFYEGTGCLAVDGTAPSDGMAIVMKGLCGSASR